MEAVSNKNAFQRAMVRQIAVEPVGSTWFKRNLALVVEALHTLNKLSTNSYTDGIGLASIKQWRLLVFEGRLEFWVFANLQY